MPNSAESQPMTVPAMPVPTGPGIWRSALGLRFSPICRAMVQAKQPMMMLRVLALSWLAVRPPSQAPMNMPAPRRRIITQSTAPASDVPAGN